jgi:eukaryotic-like serine/threonine-protein kinase
VLIFGRSTNQGTATPPVAVETVLSIESDPPGAMLELDGRSVGKAPTTVSDISVGAHKVKATMEGFEPNDVAVKISRAGERTNMVVTLKELAGTTVGVDDAGVTTVTFVPPTPDPPIKTPKVTPKGRLSLNTVPWSEVYLGTKKLGDTPLVNIQLPAGTHTLRLFNPDKKIEKKVSVEIKAGETVKRNEKL